MPIRFSREFDQFILKYTKQQRGKAHQSKLVVANLFLNDCLKLEKFISTVISSLFDSAAPSIRHPSILFGLLEIFPELIHEGTSQRMCPDDTAETRLFAFAEKQQCLQIQGARETGWGCGDPQAQEMLEVGLERAYR